MNKKIIISLIFPAMLFSLLVLDNAHGKEKVFITVKNIEEQVQLAEKAEERVERLRERKEEMMGVEEKVSPLLQRVGVDERAVMLVLRRARATVDKRMRDGKEDLEEILERKRIIEQEKRAERAEEIVGNLMDSVKEEKRERLQRVVERTREFRKRLGQEE